MTSADASAISVIVKASRSLTVTRPSDTRVVAADNRDDVINAGDGGVAKQPRQTCKAEGAPHVPSVLGLHT
jgi:hypothetical protein